MTLGTESSQHPVIPQNTPKLNPLQQRLVDELCTTGVTMCHFDELFQDRDLWRSLAVQVSEFSSKYPQDQKPLITVNNALPTFGLNSLILDVANSYLGMCSKLIYFDMWYTLPLNTDTRFASHRWHRDPEERRKIRTFLYFSEASQGATSEARTNTCFAGKGR